MSARFRAAIVCALIVCGFAAPSAAQTNAAQTKDERAKVLIGLARVKREAGDANAARRHFEEAAAVRPFEPKEREEYFWVLAGVDAKAAITTGRAILADAQGQAPVRDRLIGLFLAQGDESSIVALAADGERHQPGMALWPRRLGQSALRSGNALVAIAAFERAQRKTDTTSEDEDGRVHAVELRDRASAKVAAPKVPTAADRLALIESQIQHGDPKAAKALTAWIDKNGCSQQTLTLADRLRDPDGTDVLIRLLNTPGCPTSPKWIERGIERTVAIGKHSTARALLAKLPAASANLPAMRRLAGQLALWTGNPAEAIVTLEAVIKQTPTDRAARTSLVDAYRAVGRPRDAWAMAEPLTKQPESTGRLLTYAAIAFEAGKPADAFQLLEALTPADLDPSAALMLLDSAIAINGHAGALVSARRITAEKPEWREVVARQYLIEALAGDPARAKAKRAVLAGWDSRAAAAVDEQIATAMLSLAHTRAAAGNPEGALVALGPASGWNQLSIEARRVAADSLRALGRPADAINVLRDTPGNAADAKLLAELHASIGRDALAKGNRDAARVSAERAVALDSSRTDVWVMLADLIADGGPDALALLTERGAPTAAVAAFHLSRARGFAAAQDWNAALGSIDALLRVDAGNVAGQRLQADVLSWSGRHAESLAAYDAYLSKQPDDVEAARQQARVFGWAGQYSESKRRYARLVESHAGSTVVLAEAEAKTAFFDGRWSSAIDAYGRWLAIEPNNGEAAFERAESLRAAGRVVEADAALKALASASSHQMAGPAWDRVQMSRRPTVSVLTESKSSDGYNGRRLLDLEGAGGSFDATAHHGALTTGVQTSYVRLSGGDASRRGYRVGGALAFDSSATVKLRGRAIAWNLDGVGVLPEYMARVDWRASDRWAVGLGGDRSLVLENLDVVDRKLAATGMFSGARFDSPASTFDLNVGYHYLTDDNRRARATVTYDRRLSERLSGLRMLVWAEALSFENSAVDYYSPARQLRLDAGLQYAHEFRALKFRQDLRKRLSMGYLIGTDRDGVVYHHPTVNLTLDFANGLALVARGDWIQSDVYTERSFSIGMTVTPGGRK